MAMARGRRFRITVRCGGQMLTPAGRLIALGAGCMNLTGDGRGFPMTTGAGLLITTGAGCMSMAGGDGGRGRLTGIRSIVPSGRQRMFHSLDSAAASALELASALASVDGDRLAGCRSGREIVFILGMGGTAAALEFADSANITAADLPRCTAVRVFRT